MDTDYLSPLSLNYAADILALVYENEKIMATDMLRIAKNYRTVINTANELVDLGLLDMHLESKSRLMKVYTLTPKGKAIGKRMCECRTILGESTVMDREGEEPEKIVPEKTKNPDKKGKKKKKNKKRHPPDNVLSREKSE